MNNISLDLVGCIIFMPIIFFVILCMIGVGLSSLLPDKWFIKWYLPKQKKYSLKLDPLYKINNRSGHYFIEKYVLGWDELFWFILYPTYVYKWTYVYFDEIYIGNNSQLTVLLDEIKFTNMSFREYSEQRFNLLEKEKDIITKSKERRKNLILDFNTEFTANYE